jgi:signal transduction histidine kinase
MEIRKKLTYQFAAIVAVILFVSSLSIYFSFSQSRKEEFYGRLESKSKLIAQMLIEIEEIDTDLLHKIEKNNPLSLPNEKIIIYDYLNNKIYSSDEDNMLKIPDTYLNRVRLEKKLRYTQESYEILGAFYTGEYDRIVVFAAATDIFGFNKLRQLRLILFIVFITSLIIVYFAGRIFAARALKPVTNIIAEVNDIGISNIDARISEGNDTDELARLAQTFNGMLDRLETAFQTQKSFIANASHELRTPLTVITGQLEVVQMKARSNDEYLETITSVLGDIKNLNHLSNRLLLLAQASSDLTDVSFIPVRVDDTLWNARADILKRHKDYIINTSFGESITDANTLVVMANDLLLKTAISNLMDNACKYSSDHRCEVKMDVHSNFLNIHFKDSGIGIPAEDIMLIYEPFYRARNSTGIKGHGIGLSLVDKIVSQHNGSVQVFSEVNQGSEFIVTLPLHS